MIAKDFPIIFSWEPKAQRLAYWDRFEFKNPGYHAYSKWNQIFFEWKRKS
jgi:ABC-type oligopeptide transport system substrate-binding subunit